MGGDGEIKRRWIYQGKQRQLVCIYYIYKLVDICFLFFFETHFDREFIYVSRSEHHQILSDMIAFCSFHAGACARNDLLMCIYTGRIAVASIFAIYTIQRVQYLFFL